MASAALQQVRALRERVRGDLWGRTLPFWLNHSIDAEYGGYYNCLDEDGAVTQTTKHIWLQGRESWQLARIANTFSEAEIADAAARYGPLHSKKVHSGVPGMPVPAAVPLTRAALIEAAVAGAEFLRKHAVKRGADGKVELVFFALARDGTPALHQRKIFSATFVIMALGECARATGRRDLWDEAIELLDVVMGWIAKPDALGKPGLPGLPVLEPLNAPMIVLNVIMELREALGSVPGVVPAEGGAAALASARAGFYATERIWAINGILKHASDEHQAVFELVRPDGSVDVSTMDGRLLNPGHAIEAGWFLLDAVTGDAAPAGLDAAGVRAKALQIIDWAFRRGWDGDLGDGTLGAPAVTAAKAAEGGKAAPGTGAGAGTGGMIYFQDICGLTPSQLEWPMKLWWPQAESMIAFAKALNQALPAPGAATAGTPLPAEATQQLARLQLVADWTYEHLVDRTHGEWYGYADRTGAVTHRFKGGAYKGCFHVPRALLLVDLALAEAEAKLAAL